MKLIDKELFLKYKKSDTLVIWGSGSSIKNLTKNDYDYLNKFDSIGFNSVCELNIPFTFYIVGEILFNFYRANDKQKKKYVGNSPIEYINKLKSLSNSCLLIWDDNKTLHKNHFNYLNSLKNDYFKIKQYGHDPKIPVSKFKMKGKFVDKKFYNLITLLDKKILLHQYKGINSPIYFAKCMGYKKIIFVGVDLTFGADKYAIESRKEFFKKWISQIHNKNLKEHPCKKSLFNFINYLKKDIDFTTYTESKLLEIIKKHHKNINF